MDSGPSAPTRAAQLVPALLGAVVAGAVVAAVVLSGVSDQWGLDLSVYRGAVESALHSGEVYGSTFGYRLPFAYPPSALLLLAWAALPPWLVEPALYAVGLVCVALVIARVVESGERFATNFPKALVTGVASAAIVVTLPVGMTLYFGQVNLLVVTLVVLDVLGAPGRRWAGVLIGVAVAIKLTPALFLVWLAALGRWRQVRNGVVAFAALCVAAAVVYPQAFDAYVRRQAWRAVDGNQGLSANSNQGIFGMIARATAFTTWTAVAAVALSVAVAAFGVWAAVRLARADEIAVAACLVGVTTCLVSPLAWIHHWVWWPLLAVALLGSRVNGRVPLAVFIWLLAVLPPGLIAGWAPDGLSSQALASGYVVSSVAVIAYLGFAASSSRSGSTELLTSVPQSA